ncbi:hypothetical protein QTO34_002010 [Cnephaeus nilssonii]|uniref:Uncharacterized protein n=1 Tax=Cnephaeus nilssonii TaxID=3371016 RepID=A0AA40HU19_CNENI|nr:hypothetical protein QTO34_002010 [Eptesicus nilssonii]
MAEGACPHSGRVSLRRAKGTAVSPPAQDAGHRASPPGAVVPTVPGGRVLRNNDSSSESGSGNGSSTLNPSTSSSTQGDPAFPEMNGNGAVAPMDFTATAEDQPINLCDKLPPGTSLGTPSYPSDSCGTDGLRSRVK